MAMTSARIYNLNIGAAIALFIAAIGKGVTIFYALELAFKQIALAREFGQDIMFDVVMGMHPNYFLEIILVTAGVCLLLRVKAGWIFLQIFAISTVAWFLEMMIYFGNPAISTGFLMYDLLLGFTYVLAGVLLVVYHLPVVRESFQLEKWHYIAAYGGATLMLLDMNYILF